MNLLASRLTNITPATRQDISPTIIGILEYIRNKLKASHDVSNFRAVLNALRAVAETADSREIPILTKALPLVMKVAVNQSGHTADVLQCILPMRLDVLLASGSYFNRHNTPAQRSVPAYYPIFTTLLVFAIVRCVTCSRWTPMASGIVIEASPAHSKLRCYRWCPPDRAECSGRTCCTLILYIAVLEHR